MKVYLSGKLALISTVASLVAWIQRTGEFFSLYPILFWMGQGIFAIIIISTICFVLSHWDEKYQISKKRMVASVLNICVLYLIAWTNSKYAWFLILICGVSEMYFIQKYLKLYK